MKAVAQHAVGEPADVLKIIDVPINNPPAAGEVLIDIRAASVHHGDLAQIRFQQDIPAELGHVRRGTEGVGIVRALGPGVEAQGGLKVGDRVIAFPAPGCWAQSVAVPVTAAIPVPPEISDDVAAQLFVNYTTARMILRGLRQSVSAEALRDGVVLVTGASTVVARLLLILLDRNGLRAIGLARSAASAKRVAAELPGTKMAAVEDDDWRARITRLAAGKKVVGVLDCVSGPLLGELVPLLAEGAAIVTYGALGGNQLAIGTNAIVGLKLTIRGVVLWQWHVELSHDEQQEDISSAFALASEVPSLFKVSRVYGLAEADQAVIAVEAPNRDGFILLKP